MKQTLLEYFHFTKSEKRGIAVLFGLILIAFLLPKLFGLFQEEKEYDFTEFEEQIASWEAAIIEERNEKKYSSKTWGNKYPKYSGNKKNKYPSNKKYKKKTVKINPFPFDPNTASEDVLLELGLPSKIIGTFINFRNKGGKFYKKEDLKKVYGFKEEWYAELEGYIIIPKKENNKFNSDEVTENKNMTPNNYGNIGGKINKDIPGKNLKKAYEKIIVDINKGTSEDFQKIRGIGPYYANKIIDKRDALGGFHATEQLVELMPDSVFQKIMPSIELNSKSVRQININTADADELKSHPYIKWRTASAIVKYRQTHGEFNTVEDLRKIYSIKGELYEKIAPYLTVE